jgi:hypothetical protein
MAPCLIYWLQAIWLLANEPKASLRNWDVSVPIPVPANEFNSAELTNISKPVRTFSPGSTGLRGSKSVVQAIPAPRLPKANDVSNQVDCDGSK